MERVRGISLDECLILEVSPGSGRLTACMKRFQLDNSFSIDRAAGKCCAPRIVVDLSTDEGRKQFANVLSETNLIYVHFSPPCHTTSRARLHQFAGAPAILRTDSCPDGVPNLKPSDQLRVDAANAYLEAVAAACKTCFDRLVSLSNPESSFIWTTKPMRRLLQQVPMFVTSFHLCSFASPFKKAMKILHTLPRFLELHKPCTGGHPHKFYAKGVKTFFDRDLDFPWSLCQTMAQLLQDQLLDMGAKPLPQDLGHSNATVAAARAAAGWQSNKKILPLVREFKHVVNVSGTFDASFVQSLHVGSKLTESWTVPATSTATPCYVASVPSGSKVLPHPNQAGGKCRGCYSSGRAFSAGMYWSPAAG